MPGLEKNILKVTVFIDIKNIHSICSVRVLITQGSNNENGLLVEIKGTHSKTAHVRSK